MSQTYENYSPKGSMCLTCKHAYRDCSHLPFRVMPVLSNKGNTAIVRCTDFAQKQKASQ